MRVLKRVWLSEAEREPVTRTICRGAMLPDEVALGCYHADLVELGVARSAERGESQVVVMRDLGVWTENAFAIEAKKVAACPAAQAAGESGYSEATISAALRFVNAARTHYQRVVSHPEEFVLPGAGPRADPEGWKKARVAEAQSALERDVEPAWAVLIRAFRTWGSGWGSE